MKTIYLDSEYRCHLENAEGRRAVETALFDGKAEKLIEGYRYVPLGETWIREDGVEFPGEMIGAAVPYELLIKAQEQYEVDQESMSELTEALAIMGVTE